MVSSQHVNTGCPDDGFSGERKLIARVKGSRCISSRLVFPFGFLCAFLHSFTVQLFLRQPLFEPGKIGSCGQVVPFIGVL